MQRRFCLFAAVAIIAFVGFIITNSSADVLCGDANSDVAVNVSDAIWIINYVFIGGPEPNPFLSGEVNCDGSVNVSDAIWIANYVFIGGNEPCDVDGDGILDCRGDCPPTVTDIDGNVYQTVLIGDQCWMMENLKVTHYCNGDAIPKVTNDTEWQGLTTGALCNYDNNESHVATYGRLYNWYAVADSRGLAPEGWHVATDEDWKRLEMYLGMSQAEADAEGWRGTDEGGKLKEAGVAHWLPPNEGATNESGFAALPGGFRSNDSGIFGGIGIDGPLWTSTQHNTSDVYGRGLNYSLSAVNRGHGDKRVGASVRCVKDY
jgi:uncharacterized protein (TIGR02145 family)